MPPTPRTLRPNRTQVRMVVIDLDGQLDDDHPARVIWSFVEQMDLSSFYEDIAAFEHEGGRPAHDPAVLLSLWLLGTIEGIGSARELARRCETDLPFRWLCGDQPPNYHTVSDFRSSNLAQFETLLARLVASLAGEGLVSWTSVAQDGTRVRASAGTSSFRRKARLAHLETEALAKIQHLREESERDPAAVSRRKARARERATRERAERVAAAIAAANQLELEREAAGTHKSREEKAKMKRKAAKGDVRGSTTDPEARNMKMADGGIRPAYNVQVATDLDSQVIVQVYVTDARTDGAQLPVMLDAIRATHQRTPKTAVADGGFSTHAAINAVTAQGVEFICPPRFADEPSRKPYEPRKGDSAAVRAWRERMDTEAAKTIYRLRCRIEWIFARFKSWGLRAVTVRGKQTVQAVATLHAIAHNLLILVRHRADVVTQAGKLLAQA